MFAIGKLETSLLASALESEIALEKFDMFSPYTFSRMSLSA